MLKSLKKIRNVHWAFLLAALVLIVSLATLPYIHPKKDRVYASAPTSPPVNWCTSGFTDTLNSAPSGAVTVPAGDDSVVAMSNGKFIDENYDINTNTTYWFAPGVHTLGTSQYGQIDPQTGDVFEGAPGAILNGQGDNQFAFASGGNNVTIQYLTVENFVGGEGEAVVKGGGAGGSAWLVQYNTIEDSTQGAGVYLGTDDTVTDNCLTNNAEYGFGSYGGSSNVVLTDNEVSYNDSGGMYDHGGSSISCGCSGGGKFWETAGGTVTGNYVHNNGNVGIWVDTNNSGFNISDNYISSNYDIGIMYEVSYNADITDNTLIDNDWTNEATTPSDGGFPGSAIYISESGGDSRIAGAYSGTFTVSGNVLTNNWGGVVLWENANRYCSDGSDGVCTLVSPSTYTLASCAANLDGSTPSGNPDYFDNCRWKTQNVSISNNTFNMNTSDIPNCTTSNYCGFNGLFSNYGGGSGYPVIILTPVLWSRPILLFIRIITSLIIHIMDHGLFWPGTWVMRIGRLPGRTGQLRLLTNVALAERYLVVPVRVVLDKT